MYAIRPGMTTAPGLAGGGPAAIGAVPLRPVFNGNVATRDSDTRRSCAMQSHIGAIDENETARRPHLWNEGAQKSP